MEEFSHLWHALKLLTSLSEINLYTLPKKAPNPALRLHFNHLDDMVLATHSGKLYSTQLRLYKAKRGQLELRGKFQSGVYFKLKLRWIKLTYPNLLFQGQLYLGGLDATDYQYSRELGIFRQPPPTLSLHQEEYLQRPPVASIMWRPHPPIVTQPLQFK